MDADAAERYHFADFTEGAYAEMLTLAAGRLSFEPFGTAAEGPHALWRHDVDFSVHRALALARIESAHKVRSTYFFSLHSELYNLLQEPVIERARELLSLGHWAGLHFDPSFPARGQLVERAGFERGVLEQLLEAPVEALSFHNPDTATIPELDRERLAGMVNAYGAGIRDRYLYVSDSNGYWRHRRLPEVLADPGEQRLHVLTHPEWWQTEPMSPRERLERCIEGRSEHTRASYDALLERWGRENVR